MNYEKRHKASKQKFDLYDDPKDLVIGRLVGEFEDGRLAVVFGGGELWAVSQKRLVAKPCGKCSETGFYCMGVNNGRPYSSTGFDCFSCNGTGYKG